MASVGLSQSSYLSQIWRLRYFWFTLVCNDIVNRYRRSFMGVGWSLLRPLSMTFVFCIVFGAMFNQPTENYAPFLMVGMSVWQYVVESLTGGCNSFSNSAAYIRQQKVPLAIFPLRQVLSSGFHFLIALALAVAVTIYFKGVPITWALLMVPVGLTLLFFLCWFGAIVAGLMQTHFRDTGHILEIGLQILFYLTPIVYSPTLFPNRRKLLMILEWNPIYALLQTIRQPIVEGTLPGWEHMAIAVGFVVFTGLFAWACLRRLEKTLVFWV